jgi:hypothetical protein
MKYKGLVISAMLLLVVGLAQAAEKVALVEFFTTNIATKVTGGG